VTALLQTTEKTNSEWFHENDHYMETQARLECYQHIQRAVEREVRGEGDVLDVGNGGFFNYDTALAGHVTAVDLFLADGPGPTPNSAFRKGSFLQLPFPDASFDCVLQQNVFHHVVGRTVADNFRNLRLCMAEMYRCLRPGGKAVIVESTVNFAFYLFERVVFRPFQFFKRGGHPVTFQYTARQLVRVGLECGFRLEELAYIPRGLLLLQFGYRWPSCLTPASPVKLILRK
jgi:SAM-dependent methyltransferase